MGQSSSSSSERRRRNSYPPQPYYPPSYPYSSNPPYYSNPTYPNNNPIPPPPPPPPYDDDDNNNTNNSYSYQLAAGYNTLLRFVDSLMGRTTTTQRYPPYYYQGPNQGNGSWVPSPSPSYHSPSSSSSSSSSMMMPQYVEHRKAKTVKNDVNVHKDTIHLQVDEQNPDHYLVSFIFDAMVDGSVTIYYFAQEGTNGDLSPVYVDMYKPKRFPFKKGSGQKFCQPSDSGIDLGFFELEDLSKPLNGNVFPLVICAEACSQTLPTDEQVGQCKAATCAQITQAVIQKTNVGSFQAKVIKQILWANGERYELQEIFGLRNSADAEAESNDDNADDVGKECVICLSEPRNTAVLPCRHMCMCSECAKALRLQSNKCPICRQAVEKLMEINVNSTDH